MLETNETSFEMNLQRFRSLDSAGERHCAREFEAVWYKNQGKYLYQLCARPFKELEEDDGEMEKLGFLAISCMSLCGIIILPLLSVIVYRHSQDM